MIATDSMSLQSLSVPVIKRDFGRSGSVTGPRQLVAVSEECDRIGVVVVLVRWRNPNEIQQLLRHGGVA